MTRPCALANDDGQGTVEWVGLVLVVSLLALSLAALAGLALPGAALGRAIAEKVICAVGLADECAAGSEALDPLELAYGEELAALSRGHAPAILYEPGMKALPVDYRRCREDACADGAGAGEVARSIDGEPTVAFLRVIDCRPGSPTATPPAEANCSGERGGNVYVQYWLYYPGSATGEGSIAPGVVRTLTGGASHHPDDWESFSVRLGPGGAAQRASSHRGYGSGWADETGLYYVAGGSHAGSVEPQNTDRITPPGELALVPLETLTDADRAVAFAVTPPWLKKVWRDPEYEGTD